MASVNGSMRRDDVYMKGTIFSDGAPRGELDECALSWGLTPRDYKGKFSLRRALSNKLTLKAVDAELAAAAPSPSLKRAKKSCVSALL
jgi:hypothetical protein